MSGLIRKLEDRFSGNRAHMISSSEAKMLIKPENMANSLPDTICPGANLFEIMFC